MRNTQSPYVDYNYNVICIMFYYYFLELQLLQLSRIVTEAKIIIEIEEIIERGR